MRSVSLLFLICLSFLLPGKAAAFQAKGIRLPQAAKNRHSLFAAAPLPASQGDHIHSCHYQTTAPSVKEDDLPGYLGAAALKVRHGQGLQASASFLSAPSRWTRTALLLLYPKHAFW
ncbi:hypothetical protein V9K67_26810 [Paraflavisolibacter sp. H34]|uniref:hypothetical protein n=1 Tax=Huijunlia imazamoxiresistens TaxID=3127457 RepID=UPI003016512B